MKLLWLALACLGACARAPVVPPPDPAALLAAEKAKEAAKLKAEEDAKMAADLAVLQRQQGLAKEFETLSQAHAALVGQLQRWDAAGDVRTDPVEITLQAWPKLAALLPVREACELRLRELVDKPVHAKMPPEIAGRVRAFCDTVARGQGIVQRQVIAAARPFLTVPHWVREIADRYETQGRVNWSELKMLLDAEGIFDRRSGPHAAAAKQVGAVLPRDEMLRAAVEARARLLRAMRAGMVRMGMPAGASDRKLETQVRALWDAQGVASGELAGNLLAVTALDPAWQLLRGDHGSRQVREVAMLVLATAPEFAQGCWVVWGQLERAGGKTRLLRSDDVRRLRCVDDKPQVPEKT